MLDSQAYQASLDAMQKAMLDENNNMKTCTTGEIAIAVIEAYLDNSEKNNALER